MRIELIVVFTIDGFVTMLSWLHVTFTATTEDVLYLAIACLREDRELHPAQIS